MTKFKVLILVALLLALSGCNSPTSESIKAEVRIIDVDAYRRLTDYIPSYWYYFVKFGIEETGGVGITVISIRVTFFDAGGVSVASFRPDVLYSLGTSRVSANDSWHGSCNINEADIPRTPVTVKVTVSWTDDNNHGGSSTASGPVT